MIEVLKQALESMQRIDAWLIQRGYTGLMPQEKEVIINLEKAIAGLESQEPVAWINVEERKLEWAKPMSWNTPTTVNIPKIPLYTHQPQRTWVGLTDDERLEAAEIDGADEWFWKVCKAIEAKLKEKNNA